MTYDDVQALALRLAGVEIGTSYGTPALKVRGKLLLRLKEDRETIALCAVLPDERDVLMATAPEAFFFTEHYRRYPVVLVRLAAVDPAWFEDVLRLSWQRLAPRKLAAR